MNKTALIVVDMVKDFTDPQGLVYYPQNEQVLPTIAKVIEACRAHGKEIIFMQHCYRKDKPEKNLVNMRPNCLEGSGGEDYVIKKRRYSAFFGTDLDLVLRENHVENVIIVGTKTNCCIRATVTDAYYLDYNTIVLSDCVATNSEEVNRVHLEDIRKYFGTVMTSEELFKKLEAGVL